MSLPSKILPFHLSSMSSCLAPLCNVNHFCIVSNYCFSPISLKLIFTSYKLAQLLPKIPSFFFSSWFSRTMQRYQCRMTLKSTLSLFCTGDSGKSPESQCGTCCVTQRSLKSGGQEKTSWYITSETVKNLEQSSHATCCWNHNCDTIRNACLNT